MKVSPSRTIKFTETCLRQVSCVPRYSSRYSRKDYTLRQHVVLLCLKVRIKQNYRDFCELLELMPDILELLELERVPHWTTLNKVFLRLQNRVFAILLQIESSGYASIDATGFDRRHASRQYTSRCKMHVKSMKTTFLVDTANLNILDIHCTTTRKHDSKIVLPLTEHHKLKILCADRGYDDSKVRRTLRNRGTRPLIPHRVFMQKQKYWNSMINQKLYHQRSLSETVNSVIKRKFSDKLYSKHWRTQKKELKLLAIVYNIDKNLSVYLRVSTELI
jgi:IS5 family transposase